MYQMSNKIIFFCVFFCLSFMLNAQEHPKLILTKEGVTKIREQLGNVPLFDASLSAVKKEVDTEIASGIHMPIPKDFSGGYTHERHKKNFLITQKAGVLYQILNDEKYAIYVRDMLMQYADLYPKLPVHPQERSYARGKLFWQCLNDSNWLVYTSQAYDCVYDFLTKKDRKHLEKNLFIPFANFISEGNPQFFNRVHNHSTWGNVAVGMIALVMDNDELLQKALYGLKTDNLTADMRDNDGGFIKTEGQKVGFFANLDEPFSPDGYYTEGPYYQRYAMYPFLIFAEALQNKKPELEIFKYKDSVLSKSVSTLINLSDSDGDFFPINDGQKGMSYYSRELVTAVDIAYHYGNKNPQLLSIADKQGKVVLDDSGLAVALAIKNGEAQPFIKKSIELTDGSEGREGGVGILRNQDIELVFKYAAQGLSHGHYDKLSYSLYESGHEVVQDYGLARFVNIEQKGGGNYLKENTTWAKQTIAHNTIVQNETSHFNGSYEIGSKYHSEKYFFDSSNAYVQIASAKENNAYTGTNLHRTMAIVKDSSYANPYVLDIVNITSDKENQYDLPFYYKGHLMQTSFKYTTPEILKQLGTENGYQHLYVEGKGAVDNVNNIKFNWLLNDKFYTLTSVVEKNDELLLTRIGANDPNFNLRREAGFIQRKKNTKNAIFVSIIESHGNYSPVSEIAVNAYSQIQKIEVLVNNDLYTAIGILNDQHKFNILVIANRDNNKENNHKLVIKNKEYTWSGPYAFLNLIK